MGKKLNKTAKSNLMTYGIVIAACDQCMTVACRVREWYSSSISRDCWFRSASISIHGSFPEPDCWYPGRAESWPCRIYVRGSICERTVFKHVQEDVIPHDVVFGFSLALLIGTCSSCCIRFADRNSGTASEGRLSGHRYAGIW